MTINNLQQLKEAKQELTDKVNALHEEHKKLLVYAPNVADQRAPRHLYVINNQAQLDRIEIKLKELARIKQRITDFYGDETRRNNLMIPVILKDVAVVRIWLNNAVSSRKITKETIVNRLSKYLEISKRYIESEQLQSASKLANELNTFKESSEKDYVIRSVAAQDVTMRIYFENNEESRLRLTSAGLFVVGKDFLAPRILPPKSEKTNVREGVYENLTPIPYTGAPSALLYKSSEVEREKIRLKFDQDNVIDKKKAQPKAPAKKAAN